MSDEDDDNEFFDAMQDPAEFITVPADPKYHRLAVTATGFNLSVLLTFLQRINFFCVSLHQEIGQQRKWFQRRDWNG